MVPQGGERREAAACSSGRRRVAATGGTVPHQRALAVLMVRSWCILPKYHGRQAEERAGIGEVAMPGAAAGAAGAAGAPESEIIRDAVRCNAIGALSADGWGPMSRRQRRLYSCALGRRCFCGTQAVSPITSPCTGRVRLACEPVVDTLLGGGLRVSRGGLGGLPGGVEAPGAPTTPPWGLEECWGWARGAHRL